MRQLNGFILYVINIDCTISLEQSDRLIFQLMQVKGIQMNYYTWMKWNLLIQNVA